MRKRVLLLLFVAFAPLFAQQTTAHAPVPVTTVHGHQMAESVETFLTTEGIDCSPKQKATNIKEVCRSPVQDKPIVIYSNGFGYVVKDGKLVGVQYSEFRPPSFATVLFELRQKYGEPLKTDVDVVQNAYGARWDVHRAAWVMPDGVAIVAQEGSSFDRPSTDVRFLAKEFKEWVLRSTPSEKNPF